MRHHPALSGTTPRPAWLPIGLGSLLRLVQIWMPVLGVHSWRQADTAAMARHFSLAGTPIWLPQIDWGGASAGVKTVMGLGTRIGRVVKIKQNHSKSRGFEPAHRNIEIPVNTRKFKVKKNQL